MKKLFILPTVVILALIGWGLVKADLTPNVQVNPLSSYKLRVATSVSSTWWTSRLVGYWSFDGPMTTTTSGATAGTRDVSGNGNWGTFNGGVKPVGGIVGQALSFDGVDDYVRISDSASLDITSAITIEAWIKANVYSGEKVILTKADQDPYKFEMAGANTYFIINSGAQHYEGGKTISTAIPVGTWGHVAVTWDKTTGLATFYANGASLGAVASGVTNDLNITTSNVWLGSVNGGAQFFNGSIDEVRIYNRALSADEVMEQFMKTRRNLVM